MSREDMDALRRWVAGWSKAGPELERVRLAELSAVDVAKAIERLEDAFLAAVRQTPPRKSSGLVEQQRWFGRLRA